MASDDLHLSWERTERRLREARAHLLTNTALAFGDEFLDFEGFLQHNELGDA